jgi:3-deoxy-D-manno-octulosonic-acid transferase
MPILESTYAAAARAARLALPLLARGDGKVACGVRGRRGVVARLEAWAAAARDPRRPLVWFHAPSVGEGLQACAVVEALRARRPEVQVAYTFFSPSAERFAASVPADVADYLPFDAPGEVRRALDALRPATIAFSKSDVWPVLTREARRRGVGLALLSATLPAASSRLGAAARALLGPAYRRLDAIGAIAAADAERFGRLGVPAERRTVTGDARFDQVRRRADAVDRTAPPLALLAWDGPTLVAGSTWPADEARLLSAVAAVRGGGVPLRLVLAPHEPTPAHLAGAEARLDALGIPSVRLGQVEAGRTPAACVLVDRVGVLGDLYALADLAYVGGGFGTAGLHSVLEPAAFGAPVLLGPRHANAREAAVLMDAGGAFEAADASGLEARVRELATDAGSRERAGSAALAYVAGGLGAAERGAALVEALLDGR